MSNVCRSRDESVLPAFVSEELRRAREIFTAQDRTRSARRFERLLAAVRALSQDTPREPAARCHASSRD